MPLLTSPRQQPDLADRTRLGRFPHRLDRPLRRGRKPADQRCSIPASNRPSKRLGSGPVVSAAHHEGEEDDDDTQTDDGGQFDIHDNGSTVPSGRLDRIRLDADPARLVAEPSPVPGRISLASIAPTTRAPTPTRRDRRAWQKNGPKSTVGGAGGGSGSIVVVPKVQVMVKDRPDFLAWITTPPPSPSFMSGKRIRTVSILSARVPESSYDTESDTDTRTNTDDDDDEEEGEADEDQEEQDGEDADGDGDQEEHRNRAMDRPGRPANNEPGRQAGRQGDLPKRRTHIAALFSRPRRESDDTHNTHNQRDHEHREAKYTDRGQAGRSGRLAENQFNNPSDITVTTAPASSLPLPAQTASPPAPGATGQPGETTTTATSDDGFFTPSTISNQSSTTASSSSATRPGMMDYGGFKLGSEVAPIRPAGASSRGRQMSVWEDSSSDDGHEEDDDADDNADPSARPVRRVEEVESDDSEAEQSDYIDSVDETDSDQSGHSDGRIGMIRPGALSSSAAAARPSTRTVPVLSVRSPNTSPVSPFSSSKIEQEVMPAAWPGRKENKQVTLSQVIDEAVNVLSRPTAGERAQQQEDGTGDEGQSIRPTGDLCDWPINMFPGMEYSTRSAAEARESAVSSVYHDAASPERTSFIMPTRRISEDPSRYSLRPTSLYVSTGVVDAITTEEDERPTELLDAQPDVLPYAQADDPPYARPDKGKDRQTTHSSSQNFYTPVGGTMSESSGAAGPLTSQPVDRVFPVDDVNVDEYTDQVSPLPETILPGERPAQTSSASKFRRDSLRAVSVSVRSVIGRIESIARLKGSSSSSSPANSPFTPSSQSGRPFSARPATAFSPKSLPFSLGATPMSRQPPKTAVAQPVDRKSSVVVTSASIPVHQQANRADRGNDRAYGPATVQTVMMSPTGSSPTDGFDVVRHVPPGLSPDLASPDTPASPITPHSAISTGSGSGSLTARLRKMSLSIRGRQSKKAAAAAAAAAAASVAASTGANAGAGPDPAPGVGPSDGSPTAGSAHVVAQSGIAQHQTAMPAHPWPEPDSQPAAGSSTPIGAGNDIPTGTKSGIKRPSLISRRPSVWGLSGRRNNSTSTRRDSHLDKVSPLTSPSVNTGNLPSPATPTANSGSGSGKTLRRTFSFASLFRTSSQSSGSRAERRGTDRTDSPPPPDVSRHGLTTAHPTLGQIAEVDGAEEDDQATGAESGFARQHRPTVPVPSMYGSRPNTAAAPDIDVDNCSPSAGPGPETKMQPAPTFSRNVKPMTTAASPVPATPKMKSAVPVNGRPMDDPFASGSTSYRNQPVEQVGPKLAQLPSVPQFGKSRRTMSVSPPSPKTTAVDAPDCAN